MQRTTFTVHISKLTFKLEEQLGFSGTRAES